MYKWVGLMLKLVAEKSIGVRLKLNLEEGGILLLDVSPQNVKKAVQMGKNDYYKEYFDRNKVN